MNSFHITRFNIFLKNRNLIQPIRFDPNNFKKSRFDNYFAWFRVKNIKFIFLVLVYT